MTLLALFFGFIQVTLFCIGGGYAALPVIKNVVIDHYGWLTITQFADLVGISEMTPGPIILNAATFVGSHVAGLPGAVMATAGCIVSPAVIVSVIAYFYFKYNKLSLV
ncbi:MAG: chromate transporter, partial [Clostridia bacterium]|nr:chromate transporter [Clostridia bacterium]